MTFVPILSVPASMKAKSFALQHCFSSDQKIHRIRYLVYSVREGAASEKLWEGIVSEQGSGREWEGAVSEKPNQETEERWPLK